MENLRTMTLQFLFTFGLCIVNLPYVPVVYIRDIVKNNDERNRFLAVTQFTGQAIL